jgi:hypothetical protein
MQYFTYWKNRLAKKVFAEIKNNLRNDGMFWNFENIIISIYNLFTFQYLI